MKARPVDVNRHRLPLMRIWMHGLRYRTATRVHKDLRLWLWYRVVPKT